MQSKHKVRAAFVRLASGYPLTVNVNDTYSLTVKACVFTGKVYAKLSKKGGILPFPRYRITASETLQFLRANYA